MQEDEPVEKQAWEGGGHSKQQERLEPLTILLPVVLLLVIILVLVIGSFFTRAKVIAQAQDFLRASAQEQATTLQVLLGSQAETLTAAAHDFASHDMPEDADIAAHLAPYVKNSLFLHVCFARPDGVCYVDDGTVTDVAERAYFKEAMGGRWSVQRVDDSVSHDGALIVIAVPVYRDGKVTGVLHGGYKSDMLEEIISPDVFEGDAYSIICAPGGDVVIGARAGSAMLPGDNVFASLEAVTLDKAFTVERLREAVLRGENGAFSYAAASGRRYVVYIPLHIGNETQEQWVLFNAVPESVINAEANRLTRNYILLATCIVLAFSAVFLFFVLRENRAMRILKRERDQLLASEEQNRIGMRESGLNLARYDLKTKTFYTNSEYAMQQGYSNVIENVPEEFIQAGLVAPECADAYTAFYDKLCAGESASIMSALKIADGSFHWFQMKADFLYDADNTPYMAIILFQDADEQREKNAFYAKWQQSLERRDPKSFTLFRCNLSKCSSFDKREGTLISMNFGQANKPFNERTREYAGRYVHLDDFDVYVEIVNSEYLLASYYRGKTTVSLDYRERVAEDAFRYLRLTIEMVQYPDSEDIEAFLMYEDVNNLKAQELAAKERAAFDPLKEEKNRLRTLDAYLQLQSGERSKYSRVFENSETVMVEYDWANDAFSYALNIGEHLYGHFDTRPLWQIMLSDMVADAADVKKLQEMVRALIIDTKAKSGGMAVRLKTPERVKHWFSVHAVRSADAGTAGKIILTFMDINDEVLSDEKLRYQAEHDMLTGLYNRGAFLKAVDKAVKDNPKDSFILLCCDINNFRLINARFGRLEGDKLLQYAAERFLVYAETTNGLTGRLSNDVYALLLPNLPGILDKMTDSIQSFFDDYPLNVKITGRAGAYIIADPDMNVDMMLDCASVAKESIRGKYTQCLALFDESMNEQAVIEKDIADRMEAALAEGQFDIYIQPQFNHATGQIVGAESLVRWIDPQRGVISPGAFIPVFEKNGFITKLDEYVWEMTARYLSAWIEQGNEPVPISVNVSREDTNDPALCEKLIAIVDHYNIPRHLFRLEITETMFAEDTERLTAVVRQLQQSGFLVEMDDFGSGYSSLNVLKDVPVDVLKLDMRFFSGKDSYGRGGMIINAVLRMSRWLGISTIAEGVEDKAQADFLLSVGCATIQGYLYAKPMPVASFERKFLESRSMPYIAQDVIETELDRHAFWNPDSADSQLFNSYIGPAAIFEYHDGDYEIVRMNRRFINILQINERIMLPSRGLLRFTPEDAPKFKKAVLEAVYTGNDVSVDFVCILHDGSKRLFHNTLRVMAKSEDRALIFASFGT